MTASVYARAQYRKMAEYLKENILRISQTIYLNNSFYSSVIISFQLRDDVYSELCNADQVAGIKVWD